MVELDVNIILIDMNYGRENLWGYFTAYYHGYRSMRSHMVYFCVTSFHTFILSIIGFIYWEKRRRRYKRKVKDLLRVYDFKDETVAWYLTNIGIW
jgi:hypothetical protein